MSDEATAAAPQPPSPHPDRVQLSKRPVAFRVANPSTGGWTIFAADEEDNAWARGNEIGCEYQGLYVRALAKSGEAATTEQEIEALTAIVDSYWDHGDDYPVPIKLKRLRNLVAAIHRHAPVGTRVTWGKSGNRTVTPIYNAPAGEGK